MVLQVWHWWLIFSYFISGIDGIEIIFSNLHLSLWGRWLQLRCHGNNLPRFPTHHSDRMRGTSRSLRTPRSSPKWSRCLCRNGTPWWQSRHRCTPAGDKRYTRIHYLPPDVADGAPLAVIVHLHSPFIRVGRSGKANRESALIPR